MFHDFKAKIYDLKQTNSYKISQNVTHGKLMVVGYSLLKFTTHNCVLTPINESYVAKPMPNFHHLRKGETISLLCPHKINSY